MSDDRLLRELGHLAREEKEAEQARLDERWDRLADGTLSPEEDAELRALAAASPEAREAYEAFRPLGAAFQARLVDELATAVPAATKTPAGRLLNFRRALSRNSVRFGAVAAAVAAACLFLVLRPG